MDTIWITTNEDEYEIVRPYTDLKTAVESLPEMDRLMNDYSIIDINGVVTGDLDSFWMIREYKLNPSE